MGLLLLAGVPPLVCLIYLSAIGYQNNKLYPTYVAYSISLLLWLLANAYFQSPLLINFGKAMANYMALLANISSGLGITFAFYLSCIFNPNFSIKIAKLMVVVFILFNFTLNLIPNLTIVDVNIAGYNQFVIIQGSYSPLFFGVGFCAVVWTLINFIQASRFGSKIYQQKLRYMVLGVSMVLTSTCIFHVLIPMITNNYDFAWVPPVFSIFEILFGYGLLCKHFPNVLITMHHTLPTRLPWPHLPLLCWG